MRLFLIAVATLLLAAPAVAGAPRLRLADSHPTTVRGTGFAPRERVVVRFADVHLRLRTTAGGRFVAVLRGFDRCSGGRVVAVGTSAERAVLRLPPLECAPAAAP